MRNKIFTTTVLVFTALTFVQLSTAQDPVPCPKISIDVPRPQGKFFGRGERYPIGAVAHPMGLETEWRVTWELSPAIAYTRLEDDPTTAIDPTRNDNKQILFAATPDLQETTVKVKITIDGLPSGCPNSTTASFKIQFNEKEPREIVKFPRNANPDIEEVNLFLLTNSLKDADQSVVALIVVNYTKTDTKRKLRTYTDRIASLLLEKFNFPRDKVVFAFRPGSMVVAAYGWPLEREQTLETNIDRLRIPE